MRNGPEELEDDPLDHFDHDDESQGYDDDINYDNSWPEDENDEAYDREREQEMDCQ